MGFIELLDKKNKMRAIDITFGLFVMTIGLAMARPDSPPVYCDGGDTCCTYDFPCGDGEGDCDTDDDCIGDLRCGTDNCDRGRFPFDSTDDCCYPPIPVLLPGCSGDDNCCTPENPCYDGEGDCDTDRDCVGDLRCGVDNCAGPSLGFDATDDCCYPDPTIGGPAR